MADDRLRSTRIAERRPAGGALTGTVLVLVVGFAGLVLWLALSADETMGRLRAEADRTNLRLELALPAAADPEPAEPQTAEAQSTEPPPADVPEPPAAAGPPFIEPAAAEPIEVHPVEFEPAAEAAGVISPDIEEAAADQEPAEEIMPPPPPPPPPSGTDADAGGSETSQNDLQMALLPAPDPALVETTPDGALPRVAPDGREPWRVYARPFPVDDPRPRIAIVITDLGQSGAATETAIKGLPSAVTLAFAPYSGQLERWVPEARAAGHETLLMVPMEPESYPRNDPGPQTLLTSLTPEANRQRLEWVLGRASGYVGVVNAMGSRLTSQPEVLKPVLQALEARGLLFLDSRTAVDSVVRQVGEAVGLPIAVNDRFIDDIASRDTIDLRLQELEDLARERGHAVGLAYPYPVSFERLAAWIPTLEKKGIVLAPISAIAAARMEGL